MIIGPYIRSAYTLLESLVRFDALIKKAEDLDYQYLALVDKNMNGAMAFRKALKKTTIKGIYGLEIDYQSDKVVDPIIVFAKNDRGYMALYKLSSFMQAHQVAINDLILESFIEDLVFIIPSSSDRLLTNIEKFKRLTSDLYIGLVDNDYPHQRRYNQKVKAMAKEKGILTLAFNRVLYLDKDDVEAYRILTAIKDKVTLEDVDLTSPYGAHLLSKDEIESYYESDDLKTLADLFARIYFVPDLKKTKLARYKCPSDHKSRDYLVNLARLGLEKRLKGQVSEDYRKRLDHELSVIIKMHFEDYFLIVYDFILYAKKNGIMVGPGRGSAAGSLVAYCLGITDVDPMRYGLIFERFLNSERVTMPDIDVDFPDDKRQEVIDYVKDKYGKEHTCHILTYGTLKTKQVLRDVARVIGYERIDTLCKLIPDDKIPLREAYGIKAFKDRIKADDKANYLYAMSLKLEGLPRHYSTHAAGVVLAYDDLIEVVPLVRVEEDMDSCGFTQEYLEELGLIKIDFLGLKNLSVIAEVVDDIKREEKTFRIEMIPLDDQKTYRLIDEVNTLGIFQLESSGMQNIIRKMHPKTFVDIATTIALFRPGPMNNIPLYIQNREDPNKIKYLHPSLRPILEETSGVIIYQEQIMQIAQVLAGFSMAKADIMRRAMAKKSEDILISLKGEFIAGCLENGIKEEIAQEVYDLILRFANYGFNKSHSIAYALIAYRQAYLKANYPLYFYKALLNGVINVSTKTYEYILECKRIELKILAPDINRSSFEYVIEGSNLRMPLGIIKNVGSISVKMIIEERAKNGPFKSYEETLARLKPIGKDALMSLIDAGAFDSFLLSRKTMRYNLFDALKIDLGMLIEPSLGMKLVEFTDDIKEVITKEKEVLGFSISFDPLVELKKRYRIDTEPFYKLKGKKGEIEGFGEVMKYRIITDKRGRKMAFMSVGDDTDTLELAIFASTYDRFQDIIRNSKGRYIYFKGKSDRDAIVVEKIVMKEFYEKDIDRR